MSSRPLPALLLALAALSLPAFPSPLEEGRARSERADARAVSEAQALLLETFAAMPDPEAWEEEATTGTLFRRTTAEERAANGWSPATFLVEAAPLEAASLGAAQVGLAVPVDEGEVVVLDLTLASTQGALLASSPVTHLGSPPSPPPSPLAGEPLELETVHLYAHPGPDDPATLRAAAGGGLFARVRHGGLVAELLGPEPGWSLSAVPDGLLPPEGPFALVTLQAAASGESDPDLNVIGVPGTTTTYNSATMGEIQWCTRHATNWKVLIDQTAAEISAGFAGTDAVIARKHDHCWTAASLADAQWCADTGPCYDSAGHVYPYGGDGTSTDAYLDDAWDDVSHSRLHWTFDPLRLTQVVYDGEDVLRNASGQSMCGEARTPSMAEAGSSVAMSVPQPTGCHLYVDTHETGHNFDATHDETVYGACKSVMGSSSGGSCRDNNFAAPGVAQVDACVTNSDCPRSGTG